MLNIGVLGLMDASTFLMGFKDLSHIRGKPFELLSLISEQERKT